jgi:hypothetical protein
LVKFFYYLKFLFPCSAGAAVGAAATANACGIAAAGGAALSAGAGAIASAASSLSGAGGGAASAAPSGGPRPHNSTGTRPKRKVILFLQKLKLFPHYVVVYWLQIMVGICSFNELPQVVYLMICFQGMLDPGKELFYMPSFQGFFYYNL